MSRIQCLLLVSLCFLTEGSYEYPSHSSGTTAPAAARHHPLPYWNQHGNRQQQPSQSTTKSSTALHQGASDTNNGSNSEPYCPFPDPPPPPHVTPERFLRAGKGDPQMGWRRYQETLSWRRSNQIDTILRESFPKFHVIKQHYPHYFHLRGLYNQPVFYERPAQTDIHALRKNGVDLHLLLRHYMMICEFEWQVVEPNDFANSLYVIDLQGIRISDFVGDAVRFVKKAAKISAQHYPERGGKIFIVNVPRFFKIIWQAVRPIIDESTLQKIFILRGADEIRQTLQQHIDINSIPPEYGGNSMPLGQSPEETLLWDWISHNNENAARHCGNSKCPSCNWRQPRSY